MRSNVLYLDDFLSLDDNLSNISFDSQETYELSSIYKLEEYKLEKFVKEEAIYCSFGSSNESPINSLGNDSDLTSLGHLYVQKGKSKGLDDVYRPKKVRGNGNLREGYCCDCNLWFKLKTSSYWYHMNYKHGINSRGIKYPEPETRCLDCKVEGFCKVCNTWIVLGHRKSRRSIMFGWFKHWQKIHGNNKDI